jgi:hypothetical protein
MFRIICRISFVCHLILSHSFISIKRVLPQRYYSHYHLLSFVSSAYFRTASIDDALSLYYCLTWWYYLYYLGNIHLFCHFGIDVFHNACIIIIVLLTTVVGQTTLPVLITIIIIDWHYLFVIWHLTSPFISSLDFSCHFFNWLTMCVHTASSYIFILTIIM